MRLAHRVKRSLVAGLAGAMVFALLPAGVAAADVIDTDGLDACDGAEGLVDFNDALGFFESNIECMAAYGVTVGDADGNFNSAGSVTRQQMALFIARLAVQAQNGNTDIPASAEDAFDDIADVNPPEARDAINLLASLDIVEGVGEGAYDPSGIVTRQQMASFVARAHVALGVDFTGFAPTPGVFGDEDDIAAVHLNNVLLLADVGVVEGDADGDYNPANPVTRGQMSAFIVRSIAVLDAQGLWNGEFVVEPPAPPTNQSFTVSVTDTTLVNTGGDADEVQYIASGLEAGEDYEIAVFPAGDYGEDASIKVDGMRYPDRNGMSNDTGTFTFRDQNLDDLADNNGVTQEGWADIVVVEGITTITSGTQVTATADANGEVEFYVAVGTGDYDVAVPVLWDDADGDSELDLDGDSTNSWNVPSEDFVVGGAAVFHQDEAPNGYDMEGDVIFVNIAGQFWVDDDGYQIFWGREGDSYYYDGAEVDAAMSQARFEEYLSIGDNTSDDQGTPYSRAGDTIFEIETDTLGTAVNVVIEVGDFTGDGDEDDVRVTWDLPTDLEGNDDQADVAIHAVSDTGVINTTPEATASTDEVDTLAPRQSETMLVFEDQGLAAGDWLARVRLESETDDDADWSLASNVVTVEGPAGPTITSAELTTDTVILGAIDSGDVWTLVFSDDLDPIVDGDQIWVTDEDGDLIRLEDDRGGDGIGADNTEADFTLAGDTLTVELVGNPTDIDVAGDGDFLYPATITATAGITSGGDVDLDNSTDLTIE